MFNNNFDELYNLARFVCARDIVNWARQLLQAKPKAQRSFRSRNPFQSPKLQTHAPGRRPTLATPGEAGVLGLAAPRLAGASAQKGVPAVPFQHCGVPAGGSEAERPVARESVRDPFGRQAASPRNSSALGSGPSTPAEGPEPEASFVRELFLKTFQGPIERWVCGSGNRNEESRAEAKAALRELTALMQPFLFYGGEDTLYGGLGIPQRNDYVIRVKMSGKGREVHESFVERVIGRATYEQRIANSRSRRIGNTCQRERPGYDACPAIVKKRFGGQSRKRKSKEQDVFGWDESSGMNGEESDESEEEERGECAPSAGKGAIGQEKDMMHLCAHPAAYFRKTDGNRTGVVPGLDR